MSFMHYLCVVAALRVHSVLHRYIATSSNHGAVFRLVTHPDQKARCAFAASTAYTICVSRQVIVEACALPPTRKRQRRTHSHKHTQGGGPSELTGDEHAIAHSSPQTQPRRSDGFCKCGHRCCAISLSNTKPLTHSASHSAKNPADPRIVPRMHARQTDGLIM